MINFFKKNYKILLIVFLTILVFLQFLGIYFFDKEYQLERKATNRLYKQILYKNIQINKIQENLKKKNINIENILSEEGIYFKKRINNKKINIKNITYSKFTTYDLLIGKNPDALASAYLEYYNDKIVLTTGSGQFYYGTLNENNNRFEIIKSNIQNFINYKEFYQNSQYGIKDILIIDNDIYISFTDVISNNCLTLSIYKAKINFNFLKFEKFFVPEKCVGDVFVHQGGGGRMLKFNKDYLLFTIGDYRKRELAQKEDNLYGKVFLINFITKDVKMISKGHRNIQGMYYDKNENYIVMTEMGPKGGDEINVNLNPLKNVKNYGWPISSYGIHYSKRELKSAPLHKSHKKYGFLEPVIYFVPSIGLSEIIKYDERDFLFGAMGRNIYHGSLSLNFIKLNKKMNKVKSIEKFFIDDRVRDIKYLSDKKIALLFLETSASIGVLKFNN